MNVRTLPLLLLTASAGLSAVACNSSSSSTSTADSETRHEIRFQAVMGGKEFACGGSYEGEGLGKTTLQALEFRMYTHDFFLVKADGTKVPLALDQDRRWQRDNVALLDFADDKGLCATGSPEIRTAVAGAAPAGEYSGLEFKLGLPSKLNHLDAATETPPFNDPGMWWTWKGGYKYFLLDVKTPSDKWQVHLGGTKCDGSIGAGFSCVFGNVATVSLAAFQSNQNKVVIDLSKLLADSDLEAPLVPGDGVKGCMAFPNDKECHPVFQKFGLLFESADPGPLQSIFRVDAADPAAVSPQAIVPKVEGCTDATKAEPGNACFVRSPALDVDHESEAGLSKSHNVGANCFKCHQTFGPGKGKYTAAGTIFRTNGSGHAGASVILYSDKERTTEVGRYVTDTLGNLYTTDKLPVPETPLFVDVVSAGGTVKKSMRGSKISMSCNSCHVGSFKVILDE